MDYQSEMQNWKTVEEMAEILRVKKSWLYQQTMRKGPGTIPRIKVGKHLRFVPDDVQKWILRKNAC
jgi:excisionase family DNA binding protein